MSELGSDSRHSLCVSVCLFLRLHPYRVGWLSVWACPGLWCSIWSEFHLSDCKWTACPRDARQLSGSPRKQHARSGGGSAVQRDEASCAAVSLTLQVCCIVAAIRYTVHMWVKLSMTLDYILLNRWWKWDKRFRPLTSEHFLWHRCIY